MANILFPAAGQLRRPTLAVSTLPIAFLLVMLIGIIVCGSADLINTYSPAILLSATALCLLLGRMSRSYSRRSLA